MLFPTLSKNSDNVQVGQRDRERIPLRWYGWLPFEGNTVSCTQIRPKKLEQVSAGFKSKVDLVLSSGLILNRVSFSHCTTINLAPMRSSFSCYLIAPWLKNCAGEESFRMRERHWLQRLAKSPTVCNHYFGGSREPELSLTALIRAGSQS